MKRFYRAVLLLICLFAIAGTAAASDEVAGYFGGATLSGGGGSHPAIGAAIAANTNRVLQLLGEINYVPTGSPGFSASLVDFDGGIQIRFRVPRTKVEPYALGVIGLGHFSASAGSFSSTTNSFFYGLGGGFRYFVGRNWGLRPELRFQKYTSSGGGHLGMYTVGVFYQF